jgi:hypothetical protein
LEHCHVPNSDSKHAVTAPSRRAAAERATPRAFRERVAAIVSSGVAAVLGLAPHVLHHAGPLAGTALLAGTGGVLLFGAVGFVAAIPFLLHVHRRCGNWRVPGALLALFVVVFSISTFVIGPAMSGESSATSKSTTNQTAPANPATGGHNDHHH